MARVVEKETQKTILLEKMRTKNHTKTAVLLIIMSLLMVAAFAAGTLLGFDTAMKSLSSCKQVECGDYSLDAEYCEVCETQSMILQFRERR